MTTLPATNNFWILSLISGFALMLYGFSKQSEYGELIDEYSIKYDILIHQLEENTNALKHFTTELANESKRVDERINQKIDNKYKLEILKEFNRKNKDRKIEIETEYENLRRKLDILNVEQNSKSNLYKNKRIEYLIIIVFGSFLFAIGLINLMKSQVYRDKILYSEYLNLKIKQPECQSCGMHLLYDDKFDKQSNYCSHCYANNEFVDKNISLSEFLEKIKSQLLLKGFSDSEIKSRIKKVPNLIRWRKKFDWNK